MMPKELFGCCEYEIGRLNRKDRGVQLLSLRHLEPVTEEDKLAGTVVGVGELRLPPVSVVVVDQLMTREATLVGYRGTEEAYRFVFSEPARSRVYPPRTIAARGSPS